MKTAFREFPEAIFLGMSRFMWFHAPYRLLTSRPGALFGGCVHKVTRAHLSRSSNFGTLFLRNRPQLELMRHLVAEQKAKDGEVKITVFGCSRGAEVYSILWTLHSALPDLAVSLHAIDISGDILEFARKGVYRVPEPRRSQLTRGMSEEEIKDFFDVEGEYFKIKPWIKENIIWLRGAAEDEEILDLLNGQDIVTANNFLCHMNPADAERCLRNIGRSVKPGGYLIVSGVDLDVRTRVAAELRWEPVLELLEEMHEGDPLLREDWPFEYWGLEPLDKRKPNWQLRYASAFRLSGRS